MNEEKKPTYVSMQEAINAYRRKLAQLRMNVETDLKHMGIKPNTPCFCGSGVKFKKCCKSKITTLENIVKVTSHFGIKIDPDFLLSMQDISTYIEEQFKLSSVLAKNIIEAPVSDTESTEAKTDATASEVTDTPVAAVKETI